MKIQINRSRKTVQLPCRYAVQQTSRLLVFGGLNETCFMSSIPKFCQHAARLYFLALRHELHHKKPRKHNILSLNHAIDNQALKVWDIKHHIEQCIREGSLTGVLYFKKSLDHEIDVLNGLKKRIRFMMRGKQENSNGIGADKILQAKSVPIETLINFNRAGFAKCIWHDEKTPSMKLMKDNHVHCFGCQAHGDSLDVYMHLNGCDFQTAIRALQ